MVEWNHKIHTKRTRTQVERVWEELWLAPLTQNRDKDDQDRVVVDLIQSIITITITAVRERLCTEEQEGIDTCKRGRMIRVCSPVDPMHTNMHPIIQYP